jgi:hypothetical protein
MVRCVLHPVRALLDIGGQAGLKIDQTNEAAVFWPIPEGPGTQLIIRVLLSYRSHRLSFVLLNCKVPAASCVSE